MAQAFDAFSVATKGYACGIGTTGFFAFAIASKGYICDAEVLRGGDSSKRHLLSIEEIRRQEDDEVIAILAIVAREF